MSSFCENCGNPLQADEVCKCQQPVNQEAQRTEDVNIQKTSTYTENDGDLLHNEPPKENPAVKIVKEMASSPLFLAVCVLISLQIVVATIFPISQKAVYDGIYSNLIKSTRDINLTMGNFYTLLAIFMIIGLTPYGLVNTGMWMFYAYGKNNAGNNVGAAGLTMIRVVFIIYIWLTVLLSVLVICGSILLLNSGIFSEAGIDAVVTKTLVSVFIFISTIIIGLVVSYYFAVVRTVKTVRNTILTGIPSNKVSGYVAVLNFIYSAFMLIVLIPMLTSGSVIAIISAISCIAFLIILGIWIFQYKNRMTDFIISEGVKIC